MEMRLSGLEACREELHGQRRQLHSGLERLAEVRAQMGMNPGLEPLAAQLAALCEALEKEAGQLQQMEIALERIAQCANYHEQDITASADQSRRVYPARAVTVASLEYLEPLMQGMEFK